MSLTESVADNGVGAGTCAASGSAMVASRTIEVRSLERIIRKTGLKVRTKRRRADFCFTTRRSAIATSLPIVAATRQVDASALQFSGIQYRAIRQCRCGFALGETGLYSPGQ